MMNGPKDYPLNRVLRWLRGWVKSWTANTAMVLTILGVVQANLPMLNLTPAQQGYALIVIGVLMAVLRAKTNTAVSQK